MFKVLVSAVTADKKLTQILKSQVATQKKLSVNGGLNSKSLFYR